MARVALYSWRIATDTLRTVYRDSDDLSLITFGTTSTIGSSEAQPPTDIPVGSACQPGTFNRYNYYPQVLSPYARFTIEPNSTYCGYIPTPCDIAIAHFIVTDETDPGLEDGTINIFATSSFAITLYHLQNITNTFFLENTTGFFENLSPDTYKVYAQDSRGCAMADQIGVVHPFTEDYTHYKYRLQFNSINSPDVWELRLIDRNNNYLKTEYPKDVDGTASPIVSRQVNSDEDKTTAIISRNLEINLIYDGLIFTTDEFTLSKERQWKVELYRNDEIEFAGWLIADEIQDLYSDPEYVFQLTATDGLPSLKGNVFGDGSGGNGYSNSQIQQYGVDGWGKLVKQCLDQLGYDYGTPKFLSSLRFNATYDANLWANLGTWSDILYDTEGVAVDTYTALDTLLRGVKLMIMQHKGQFIFVNNNDYFYATNPITNVEYQKAFYELDAGFNVHVALGLDVIHPDIQFVGFDQPLIPINPTQSLNYDKAYNITSKIDFTYLALLYENPSFEIGSVEGGLPPNFQLETDGTVDYQLHDVGDLAYLGNWIFTGTYLTDSFTPSNSAHAHFIDSVIIDQTNKLLNISFQWKAYNVLLTGGDLSSTSSRPIIGVVYRDNTTGHLYEYANGGTPRWVLLVGGIAPSLSGFQIVQDFQQWQAFTSSTPIFPESGLGVIDIYFFGPDGNLPSGDPGNVVSGQTIRVDYDQLTLTLSDGNDQYSLQTGETHTVTAVTGIPQANSKQVDLKLFTYPNNKRVAGNVFTQNDYAIGLVQNKWNFALKSADPQDRLAATIIKAFSRNYQRPMRIFEGDVQGSYLSFYGVFILRWYEDSIFMPYSIEMDIRMGTAHVVLIEVSDESNQAVYKYTPIYEKSARQLISN